MYFGAVELVCPELGICGSLSWNSCFEIVLYRLFGGYHTLSDLQLGGEYYK
jgi:hypothetical protein